MHSNWERRKASSRSLWEKKTPEVDAGCMIRAEQKKIAAHVLEVMYISYTHKSARKTDMSAWNVFQAERRRKCIQVVQTDRLLSLSDSLCDLGLNQK